MPFRNHREGLRVLGSFIDHVDYNDCVERILSWGRTGQSRSVCICNVHVLVTAHADTELQTAINTSDMATPDGMPVAWTLRKYGFPDAQRISGPDLMSAILSRLNHENLPVFFYGSTGSTLDRLKQGLCQRFPHLNIAGSYSPPFRELTTSEDRQVVEMLNSSGARIIFVGLGCPKQELWIAAHRGKVKAVMIGVGAAFDFHAGNIKRAPLVMQHLGLEWLHRLLQEPQRLFRRYLVTNLIFLRCALQKKLVNL